MPDYFVSRFFLVASCVSFMASCADDRHVASPTVKPLVEAVYASGYVMAEDQYKVFALAEGFLEAKLVEAGDAVEKGQPLFVIDAVEQSARYDIARENYELALRNYREGSPYLAELEASAAISRAKMEHDSVNFRRYSNLWERNATSRGAYDRAKLAWESSQQEYRLQQSRLKNARNQLHLALQNARNQLRITGEESSRFTVRSQLDGRVFSTSKDEGELVRRGEVLAEVGRDSGFYLQLNVDELDIHRVRPGQEVLVSIDAYPGQVYKATVTRIFPMINQQQQSIRVDAALRSTVPGKFSGLALEANIIIRQKEKAMVISRSALLPGDSVMLKTDAGEKKVKVVTGIETLDEVEIVEGLEASDRLIVGR